MLYTKEKDSYTLPCVISDGEVYKATQSLWGEYFESASQQEIIDTFKFQCISHDLTPFIDSLPSIPKEKLCTVLPTTPKLIPKQEILKLIKIFLHFSDLGLEAGASLLYHPELGYKFIIGKHKVVSSTFCSTGGKDWPFVDLDGNKTTIQESIENGFSIVGRFHSHHSMPPTPSGIDDADEIGKGLLLCCITGNVAVDDFSGTYFWENYVSLATPFGRISVEEASYIEPYDFFDITEVYVNGIPNIILDYVSAGITKPKVINPSFPVTTPSYSWLPKPKSRKKKKNRFISSGILNALPISVLLELQDAIDETLEKGQYSLDNGYYEN